MVFTSGPRFLILFSVLIVGSCCVFLNSVQASSVRINEVAWMGTASSSSEEWLEFFNTGTSSVDMSGWSVYGADTGECLNFSDADGTSTAVIPAGDYLVYGNSEEIPEADIWDATIGLNNSDPGELKLFSEPGCPSDATSADEVLNGEEWLAGNNDTKHTMARGEDGDWHDSAEPEGSPGETNSVTASSSPESGEDEESSSSDSSDSASDKDGSASANSSSGSSSDSGTDSQEDSAETKKGSLVINEIFPNPEGKDRDKEFIELYNSGSQEIELAGWKLKNRRGKTFEFGRYEFLRDLPRKLGDGEFLRLTRPSSGLVLNNNREVLKLFSPSGKLKQKVEYKKAPEGLSYCNPEHLDPDHLATPTKMFLRHSLNPGAWNWSKKVTPTGPNRIDPINRPPRVDFSFPEDIQAGKPVSFDSSDTVDPDGDSLRFRWNFDDGTELTVPMPAHTFLEPGEYSVTLQVSDGRTTSSRTRAVSIPDPSSAESKERTVRATSSENISASASSRRATSSRNKKAQPGSSNPETGGFPFFDLKNIRSVPEEDKVMTRGKVAVRPGVLGKQYFYMVGSPGIQVYNYHKDFPNLSRGDRIQVRGEISISRQEKRINTSEVEDIQVLSDGTPPQPREVECHAVSRRVGSLVTTDGIITDTETNKLYLDNNRGEAVVYLQESLDLAEGLISAGRNAEVTGLVNRYGDRTRILPRDKKDIEVSTSSSASSSEKKGEVLGASSRKSGKSGDKLVLSSSDKENNYFAYLTEILLGGAIILLIWMIKMSFSQKEK